MSYAEQDRIKKEIREKYADELKLTRQNSSKSLVIPTEPADASQKFGKLPKSFIQYDFLVEVPNMGFNMDNEFGDKLMRLKIEGFSVSFNQSDEETNADL